MSSIVPLQRGGTLRRLSRAAAAPALGAALAAATMSVIPFAIAQPAQAPITAPPGLAAVLPSFADLSDRVSPAVVNVSTERAVRGGGSGEMGLPQFPEGSPLNELFRRYFEQGPGAGRQGRGPSAPDRKARAAGSGFVVDPAGFIVTNNHVIDGADEITVTMQDGTELKAKLIGRDPKTDLAVLKVDAGRPLPYVAMGDSNRARVGDWVVAVGNPFGLGGTVTVGVLSARGRDLQSGPFDDYLQIDASINRGNSGGPTFNLAGEVIGINTAIYSPNGGSVGIGFAVPSNLAKPVIEQLKATGKVERGWLGVQIQPVTPDIADSVSLDRPRGALVTSVQGDSPALKAGVRQGDVIVGFNNRAVDRVRDLTQAVAMTTAGSRSEVVVWRDGKEVRLTANIARLDAEKAAANDDPAADEQSGKLGLALAPLDQEARREHRIPASVRGVLVQKVESDSAAADKGIRAGDVIVKIGGRNVSNPDEVAERVTAAQGERRKSILLLVNRQGTERFVALPLGQA
ncbi:serine protease Do [Stella humosa]|uniref:Probable periplasmic serine endoprotease DegP-like n=1 Tax=Stella humosa TaxID=94 RepID=A0A3N1M1Z6_9PROT|nr:DegQ family serine endoprotease [Stella humosa]ROP99741.1 serine protease Do [Stella humosa]BBK31032.1 serine protease [Stella humosa]